MKTAKCVCKINAASNYGQVPHTTVYNVLEAVTTLSQPAWLQTHDSPNHVEMHGELVANQAHHPPVNH